MKNNRISTQPKRGFTLIELLVVIAIIAILAAILFPVFAQAKEAGKTTQTLSNGKQVVLATLTYVSDNDDTLPAAGIGVRSQNTSDAAYFQWQNTIYKYVKSPEILRSPADSTTNPRTELATLAVCRKSLTSRVNTNSVVSWITNFNFSPPPQDLNGVFTRLTLNASTPTAPADFMLFVNGLRATGPQGSGQIPSSIPDANGDTCSLWFGIYGMSSDGGARHVTNAGAADRIYTAAPHHKGGVVMAFLDGHARFYGCGEGENSEKRLEGQAPWCKIGYPTSQDPSCVKKWNDLDN